MDIDFYETKDWVEASLLFTFHIPFKGMERNGSICYFQFKNRLRSEEIIECFWRGDLKGNLREFTEAQRRIKDLIHRGYGNGKSGNQRIEK